MLHRMLVYTALKTSGPSRLGASKFSQPTDFLSSTHRRSDLFDVHVGLTTPRAKTQTKKKRLRFSRSRFFV